MRAQANESKALVPRGERIVLRIDGDENATGPRTASARIRNRDCGESLAKCAPLVAAIDAQATKQVPADGRIRRAVQTERCQHMRIDPDREWREREEADDRITCLAIDRDGDTAKTHRLLCERIGAQIQIDRRVP